MKRLLALCVALAAAGAAAGALNLEQGRLRLTLHDGIGRFSLSYVPDRAGAGYTPLMLDEDPRTTVLSVIDGNRVHRMGESAAFAEKLEQTSNGAAFVWTATTLEVRESFGFVASRDSVLADGVRIDVTVRNLGETPRTVGLRYLFDTSLGEASGQHFWTPTAVRIDREHTLVPSETDRYWASAATNGGEGLQVMVSGPGITRPERVVFANWKRLNEAAWDYETASTRNFNQPPYSINDSAVAQYYSQREIAPGGTFSATLVLGLYNKNGFAPDLAAPDSAVARIAEKAAAAALVADPQLALKSDVEILDRLIEEINRQLVSGGVSETDLALMEKLVADLLSKYR